MQYQGFQDTQAVLCQYVFSVFQVFFPNRKCDLDAGAKDPKALETLVNSMNVKTESVNRDLTAYKGILSKLSAAKELMAELMAREKKKQEERYASSLSTLKIIWAQSRHICTTMLHSIGTEYDPCLLACAWFLHTGREPLTAHHEV